MRYEPGWGARLDPAEIDRLLTERRIEVVFATLCETSTGIVHDVQAIAEVAERHGVILVVDAVSGLGAAEMKQDEWGVDVVVAGSQKALMCPPGLAFASVSQSALDFADERAGGRYYFDWGRTAKGQRKAASPFTPAVSLFLALDVALDLIEEEGLENVLARHRLLARATRAGAPRSASSSSATPTSARPSSRRSSCRRTSTAARSRARCASSASPPTAARTSSRAGSCGSPTAATSAPSTSSRRCRGLEMVLRELGHDVEHGAGVGAAQKVFLEAGVPAAA